MNKTSKFSPEVRERAVRMVLEHQGSMNRGGRRSVPWPARRAAPPRCCGNGLAKPNEIAANGRASPARRERERFKALERENRERKRANEILRLASAFFAQAELDRLRK
jgi:transposase-like protein